MKIPNQKVLSIILIILLFSMLIPLTLTSNTVAQAPDSDGDGIPDKDEIKYHTDKNDADSDDDGVLDGDEKDWNKNSDGKGDINALDHDSDDDGIYDGTEMGITADDLTNDTDLSLNRFRADEDPPSKHPNDDPNKYTTDMTLWDTDGDHLSDGEEDKNRNGKYDIALNESDPNFPDRDGDGLADNDPDEKDIDNDGMYNDYELLYELDPYDPSDAQDDPDGDTFTNLQEYLGDDNNPGNTDWSDPFNPASKPDVAPVVEFSRKRIIEEANQTITFHAGKNDPLSVYNVTDREQDYTAGLDYTWIYGDGNTEKETVYDPVKYKNRYAYKEPGEYTLTLKVKDDNEKIGEDTIRITITVPIGITSTTIDIDQDTEEKKDKNIVRRNGWIAYQIKDVRVNEKITIKYNVLETEENVGVRIFVIPENDLDTYKENNPREKTISRKYDEYWRGHLVSIARDGEIEIEATEEDDIIVIFDNNYYEEYKDTVTDNTPVEYRVEITREESPFFYILLIVIIVIVVASALIGAYFYNKLREDKGMTKVTREAAIETQRSLDREMAQLEMDIMDSMQRSRVTGKPMAAMPMQQQQQQPTGRVPGPPSAPGQAPMQPQPQPGPGAGVGIGQRQMAAPGTTPQTPKTTAAEAGAGGPTQVPGATPLPPGKAQTTPAGAQQSTPGSAPGKGQATQPQMLPPGTQAQKPKTQKQNQ